MNRVLFRGTLFSGMSHAGIVLGYAEISHAIACDQAEEVCVTAARDLGDPYTIYRLLDNPQTRAILDKSPKSITMALFEGLEPLRGNISESATIVSHAADFMRGLDEKQVGILVGYLMRVTEKLDASFIYRAVAKALVRKGWRPEDYAPGWWRSEAKLEPLVHWLDSVLFEEGYVWGKVKAGKHRGRDQLYVEVGGMTYVEDVNSHRDVVEYRSPAVGTLVVFHPKRGRRLTPRIFAVFFIVC